MLLALDRKTSTTNQIIFNYFLCNLSLFFAHSLFAPQTLGHGRKQDIFLKFGAALT